MNGQLRLALGMRGGVSLSVWIGGAGVEIDTLCRDDESGFWHDLRAVSGFDSVVVDVIAGASAGGLNGVLFAASQQYGFPLEDVRDVWLQVGGIEVLTRGGGGGPSPSLLDGDERFLRVVHDELERLIRPRAQPTQRPRIDLQLSATLVEPIIRSARSPLDEQLTARRSAARFAFHHDPRGGPTDFPPVDDATFDDALWRLALAARATSSFPVAFEGTFVRSTRAGGYATSSPPPGGQFLVDMRGVFSERNTTDESIPAEKPRQSDFVVADGGILDNIPLGKAITAIQRAPADRPTTRYLVYLHPGAPEPDPRTVGAAAQADPDRAAAIRRSTVGVLRGAFKAYYSSETINDDIAALEAHNERVARAAVIRHGTFATIPSRIRLQQVARRELNAYRLQRALEDATQIERLLDDPLNSLGEDLFPTRGGNDPDGHWRSPVAVWPAAAREQLTVRLIEAFGSRIPSNGDRALSAAEADGVFLAGVGPFARTTRLLIEWARYLEARSTSTAKDRGGQVKKRLYALAAFTELAFERPRRLGWVDHAIRPGAGQPGWVSATIDALDRLAATDGSTANAVATALLDSDDGSDAADSFAASRYDALDAEARSVGAATTAAGDVDLRTALVESVLVEHANTLRTLGESLLGLRDDLSVEPADLEGSSALALGNLLHNVLGGPDPIDPVTLAALEIVCFPEFVAGAPAQRRIDFVRLSAASPSPIAAWFDTLTAGVPAPIPDPGPDTRFVPAFPSGHTREGKPFHQEIPLKQKLAGNELLNFAAFLRDEWRTNDWMWGRLDAVPTLVELLVTPRTMKQWVRTVADPVSALHDLVVSDFQAASDRGWPAWLEENVWTIYKQQIALEVAALQTGDDAPRIDAIRGALTARRQWEILADELGRSTERGQLGTGPRPPDNCAREVQDYAVGNETVTKPARQNTIDAFRGISESLARAITWHAETFAGPRSDDPQQQGKHKKPPLVTAATWTSKAIRVGGPVAASILLSERGASSLLKRISVTVLLAVAALGLLLWAVLESWVAVILVITALLIGAIAISRIGKRARKPAATIVGADPATNDLPHHLPRPAATKSEQPDIAQLLRDPPTGSVSPGTEGIEPAPPSASAPPPPPPGSASIAGNPPPAPPPTPGA